MASKLPLKIFQNNNHVSTINLIDTKITHPSLILEKNGSRYYGALFDRKPNYKTLHVNGKYLTSIEVETGTHSFYIDFSGGSNGNTSGITTANLKNNFGFIQSVYFGMRADITHGNYDYIGFDAWIRNKHDKSKVVYYSGNWGTGSNWGHGQSFSHQLTYDEMERLGGPNSELVLEVRVHNNGGSTWVGTRNTFTITTT